MKALLWLCLLLPGSVWLAAADPAAPPVPCVEALYPSASTLPANHLKFYIHFSVPMRQGVFMEHCKLLDDHGRAVLEPFRETELWSEDGRRLTLWLHPGRQKTGVNLNTELGPVLSPGLRYTLVIAGAWPSSDGMPCGKDTQKSFFTAPRETKQLDVKDWKVQAPAAGSKQPLEIHFPTPLDHALLMRCLQVVDADGKTVAGTPSTTDAERTWRFSPAEAWRGLPHRVLVNNFMEDLAGNSLARPFEVDLEGKPPVKTPAVIDVTFKPAGRSSDE